MHKLQDMNCREINYLVLEGTYYAQNYASIIHQYLLLTHFA